jgi:hypothetical protein
LWLRDGQVGHAGNPNGKLTELGLPAFASQSQNLRPQERKGAERFQHLLAPVPGPFSLVSPPEDLANQYIRQQHY